MKIIEENWKAINEAEEMIKERTGDPEAGFGSGVFFLDGNRRLMIPIDYRKKRGDFFTQKRYQYQILAQYCPFTGKKLFEESEAVEASQK